MWRSIGSVNSHVKPNRSRQQNNYESFANASKLKLNESQLSGEASGSPFLNQYFVKKRSPEGMLQRVLSHKNIQTRQIVSPPCSAKEIASPRMRLKSEPNDTVVKEGRSSMQNDKVSIEGDIEVRKESRKQKSKQCKVLKKEIAGIKNIQSSLKEDIAGGFSLFRDQMKEVEEKITNRIQLTEQTREKQKKQSFNPQLLNKLRHQSTKFGEKMRDIDNRKEMVKEKYRNKLSKL